MNPLGYLGFVGFAVLVAVGVRRFQPAAASQIARKAGLSGAAGWGVFVLATGWTFLPVLAGAAVGDSELWVVGAAVAGLGWYLLTMAVTSVGDYRLLARADAVAPAGVNPGRLVATSGEPELETDARTPFAGAPSVHTDWLVQRRGTVGVRELWLALAEGVERAAFTLGDGAVEIPVENRRMFSGEERHVTLDPEEEPAAGTAAFLRENADLPNPDAWEKRLKSIESFVPADEPVTAVGRARQGDEPGEYVVEPAEGESSVLLVTGDADAATRLLWKRVYLIGGAGVLLALGGQLLAFLLSGASVGGFL